MTLYLDMDGVLVDFMGGARKLHPAIPEASAWPPGVYSLKEVCGMDLGRFWRAIGDEGSAWWESLEPLPGAVALYKFCQAATNGSTFILSKPSTDKASAMASAGGKVAWIQRHLGVAERYILTPHKYLLASPTAILLDDKDEEIERWRTYGGTGIVYPQPWNSRHAEAAMALMSVLGELLKLIPGLERKP